MTWGDLVVGGVILLWIAIAVYVLVRNRRKGKNSCGCNCPGCSAGRSPNVTIQEEDTCDCCKKK